MVLVIVVTKQGTFKNENVDNLEELYKCCKYKSNKDFIKLHEWDNYELWGKIKGKYSNELLQKIIYNDNFLLNLHNLSFNGFLCVCKKKEDLTLDEWNKWCKENEEYGEEGENEEEDEESVKSEKVIVNEDSDSESIINDNLSDELLEESYD